MSDLLSSINSPADLKSLSVAELQQLCAEIREYMIRCCATHPGHVGSSLGAVEIAVALHKVFDAPKDKIVWDVGHQAYAHKIITGRREEFLHKREKDGISGFPRRSESSYDAFGVGHASTSISAALGMAVADQQLGLDAHHVAIIGDGSLTGGLAFEGLNNAGSMHTNLLVILNDNQISIDKNTGALHNYLVKITTSARYNHLKKRVWTGMGEGAMRNRIQRMVRSIKRSVLRSETGNFFTSLGFRYFGPVDGNGISQLIPLLERLKNIEGPKLLHVVTTKGKGFKPAEDNQTIWHSPGKFDPETGELAASDETIARYQTVFGQTVTDLARIDNRIVGITPAMLTGGSLSIMKEAFPDRVFDVGIAEEHAVTFSAGLAASGMVPFCNIYSSFMQRAYDCLIHDVALQRLKVIFCLDRAGIVGEDGATHHGVFDIAAFRSVPNVAIASPMDELELRNMLYSAISEDYPATIIRYPRGKGAGAQWRDAAFEHISIGTARLLNDPESPQVALLSIGPIGNKCAKAVQMAAERGVAVLHYDMRFVKPVDTAALERACTLCKKIITVEDGVVAGGLHGLVAEYVADRGLGVQTIGLGVPDAFIEHGTPEELYTECGYNTSDILKAIMEG